MSDTYLLGGDEPAPLVTAPLWKQVVFVFLPSLIAFVGLDIGWIALVAGKMYDDALGKQLRSKPDIIPGILAWLCIVGALQGYALRGSPSLKAAAVRGAGLGFFLYGTFTFTNLAVISRWSWPLAVGDFGWGALLSGAITALQFFLASKFLRGSRR